jgi:hypothetical protein
MARGEVKNNRLDTDSAFKGHLLLKGEHDSAMEI